VAVIAALFIGFGLFIYEGSGAPNAPQTTASAKIVGFDVYSGSRFRPAQTNVSVEFADGRRDTFLVDADAASRCRVGDTIQLDEAKARAGFAKVMIPPRPCR